MGLTLNIKQMKLITDTVISLKSLCHTAALGRIAMEVLARVFNAVIYLS